MSTETKYYQCPACKRRPHLKLSQEVKAALPNQGVLLECEFCLHEFMVRDTTPTGAPETHVIRKPATQY